MTKKPKHYTFRFADVQNDDLHKAEGKMEKRENQHGAEEQEHEESVEIEAEPDEFIFSKAAADSLGAEWLIYVNDELRKGADPLETLITAMKLLPDDGDKKEDENNKFGYHISDDMLAKLGADFLGALDTYLKLHPGGARKAFRSEELDKLRRKDPNKKSYRYGGRIIGAESPRV